MKNSLIKLLTFFFKPIPDRLMQKIVNMLQTVRGIGSASILPFEDTGEVQVLNQVLEGMPDGAIILDIGAHQGKFIEQVSKNRLALIHAFEPMKYNYEKLRDKFSHEKNIMLNNCALGDSCRAVAMWGNFEGTSAASIFKEGLSHFDVAEKSIVHEEVEMKYLPDYFSENKVDEIYFLKIDVEGAEFMILSSIEHKLKQKKITFVQFEFGHFHIPARIYFKDFWLLFSNQYTVYRITIGGLIEIQNYSYELEVFRGATNLLCVAKGSEYLIKSLIK